MAQMKGVRKFDEVKEKRKEKKQYSNSTRINKNKKQVNFSSGSGRVINNELEKIVFV